MAGRIFIEALSAVVAVTAMANTLAVFVEAVPFVVGIGNACLFVACGVTIDYLWGRDTCR